jgi:hypothetical protein
VHSGVLRHMAYDRKIFSGFQEQKGGMCMELSDNATYPMKGLGSIFIQMPSKMMFLS